MQSILEVYSFSTHSINNWPKTVAYVSLFSLEIFTNDLTITPLSAKTDVT